jgi:hypothetical protein
MRQGTTGVPGNRGALWAGVGVACRKSNKIMLGFSPCGLVFSYLQFCSG